MRRTALITGGAVRVGRAITLALARSGHDCIVHFDKSKQAAEDLVAEVKGLGQKASLIQADLATSSGIDSMLQFLSGDFPGVDVLVNSASSFCPAPLGSITAENWDDTLNLNARAPLLLSQSLGLLMKQRGFGRIINITDCATERFYRGYLPYLISKVTLDAMTKILAMELGPEVAVNAVAPGTVLPPPGTDEAYCRQAEGRALLKKVGRPEDVADMVAYLATKADFITGQTFFVDGGASIRP
jgi:NAD(P)-dependent dehydrogenase (short-subunit alcohol dehydrogenase family)